MLKMEDRLKLVNASVAFYKTSEQVGSFYHAMKHRIIVRFLLQKNPPNPYSLVLCSYHFVIIIALSTFCCSYISRVVLIHY